MKNTAKKTNIIPELLKQDLLISQLRCMNWNAACVNCIYTTEKNDKFLQLNLSKTSNLSIHKFQFNPINLDPKYTKTLNNTYNNLLNFEKQLLFKEKHKVKIEQPPLNKDPINLDYLKLIPTYELKINTKIQKEDFKKTVVFSNINNLNEQNEFFNSELNCLVTEAMDETEKIKHSIYFQKNQLKKYSETSDKDFFTALKDNDSSLQPSFLSVWPKEKWRIKYIPKINKKSTFVFDLLPRPVQKNKYLFYHDYHMTSTAQKYEEMLYKLFKGCQEFKYKLSIPTTKISNEPLTEDINIWAYDESKDPFISIKKPNIKHEIGVLKYFITQYDRVYHYDEPDTEEKYIQSIEVIKKETEDVRPDFSGFNNEIFEETVAINTLINEFKVVDDDNEEALKKKNSGLLSWNKLNRYFKQYS